MHPEAVPARRASPDDMAFRIRSFDWQATPLGPAEAWPQALRSAVELMLASGSPMAIHWGPDFVLLYNDAWRRLAGSRHPDLLGQPGRTALASAWPRLSSLLSAVTGGSGSMRAEGDLASFGLEGESRDSWFTFSLEPIPVGDGTIGGVLSIGFKTTESVRAKEAQRLAEARQTFLLRLSDAIGPLGDAAAIKAEAARVLGEHLQTARVAYGEVEEDDEHIVFAGNYVGPGISVITGRFRMAAFGTALLEALCAGRTITVPDVTASPLLAEEERGRYASLGIAALMGVPLIKEGRLAATISIHSERPRQWTEIDVSLARETAERTWAAVERARAESALHESEEQYRSLFSAMDQGYALCRLVRGEDGQVTDYRFLQVNRAFEAFTGIDPSMVVGRLRSEVLPGSDERTLAAAARVIATGQPMRLEHYNGGLKRWYDVGLYPRSNDRFAALFSDITDRKRQEKQLREQEARHRAELEREVRDRTAELKRSRDLLQAAMDSSLDMIQVFEAIRDAEGRIVDFRWLLNNHTSESKYGTVEGESLLQRNPGVVVEGIFDAFVRVTETGIPEQAERHYAHEQFDGWFFQSVVRLGDGVATTTKDISEWKAAQQEVIRLRDEMALARIREGEESLRTAAEVGRLGLWDWNVRTGEVAWSDAHFQMEGYAIGEVEPSYEAWVARLHPEDRAETEEALRQAMQRHEDYVREFRVVHPDGSVHWLYGRGRFFYDEAGQPARMVGAMIDVTERREWEERLQVLVLELQHRTRNLMGVVRSLANSTLRSSRSLKEFQTTFLDRLAALARVNGLLSRLNEGDRIHLEELLEAELWALGLMDANRSRITLDGPHGVRLRSGTVQTFALALHELATNAVKYGAFASPQGSLAIRWQLDRQEGGTMLHLEWKESGVTVPPEEDALRRTGYGRELIERALPYQLKAKTTYRLEEDGVRCTIMMPISEG